MRAQQEALAGQRPLTQKLTVSEMVSEHMAAMRPEWAYRSYKNNEYLFEHYILPELGSKKAAGIQPKDLRAHFEKLGTAGLGVSGQKQVRSLLSGAYKRAIGDGLLRDNPTTYARPLATQQAAKLKAFTPEEARAFFAAALEDRWALPLGFMALTGLRIGEAVALTWADVATDRAGLPVVSINKTRSEFQGQPYENKPKTRAGVRLVPLSQDAADILEDMRRRVEVEAAAHGQAVGASSYVFPSPLTGLPMLHDTLRNIMERTCKRAGVPLLSPHKLRHTFASLNLASGLPVGDVSAVMGHASTAVTMNFYQTSYEVGRRAVALNLSPAKEEQAAKQDEMPAQTLLRRTRHSRKGGPRQGVRASPESD